jgi:hypothetical protein
MWSFGASKVGAALPVDRIAGWVQRGIQRLSRLRFCHFTVDRCWQPVVLKLLMSVFDVQYPVQGEAFHLLLAVSDAGAAPG